MPRKTIVKIDDMTQHITQRKRLEMLGEIKHSLVIIHIITNLLDLIIYKEEEEEKKKKKKKKEEEAKTKKKKKRM